MVAMLIALTVWLVLASKANELLLEQERGINDAKDNLLSLASHQLRTPATGVKQYLGLLLQGFAGDISPRQHDIIEKAYEGNERQLKTINDILYLARLGSGRIILTKTAFSMRELIYDVVHELSDEIEEKQHKIIIKAPKRQPKFIGDEHMIRMAVENMLTNAVKYSHKKGRIIVQATVSKGEMRVSVQDNGVGIPQDQQEHMFQQFVRIENELSIAVGGTGIGLYVVQNIADLHDGRVEVTSQVGKGSTFTLILPTRRNTKNNKV
jgi:signal transduction histidine kinase